MTHTLYPIAIIGAGPVGLAAAAHLIQKGEKPVVFEAGASAGAAIQQWGHVRLFSPWRYMLDQQALKLLEQTPWSAPDGEQYPTGHEFLEQYIAPLAQIIQEKADFHVNTRVISVTKQGFDKMKTAEREHAPFVLRIQSGNEEEQEILARAVIDASGTYGQPNSLGANGIAALGERRLSDAIFYGIPDVLGTLRQRYVGKRVLVVGSGHSAFNALLELAALAQEEPTTTITWAIRRAHLNQLFGGEGNDALPERGKLGTRIRELVTQGAVRFVTNVHVQALQRTEQGISVVGDEERLGFFDEIVATTGFRPDLSLLQELRLDLDASTESPRQLAPLIDPNVHSCGTVPPHGVDELSHTEKDLYIVGMKSYGRAPTFLMLTGYEQVRSIVAALTGDWESARNVELVLPETGVCSTDAGGCCGVPGLKSNDDETLVASTSCCGTPAVTLVQLQPVAKRRVGGCCGS